MIKDSLTKIGRIPVSVVIPIKNEEKSLGECLSRLVDFDEVIVVDSSSTDRSPQIVKDFNRKYVNFIWNGQFPKKRNWTLRNVPLKNEWVLFIDADEFVTEDFLKELSCKIVNTDCVGFWISYTINFAGRKMKYGGNARKLALFKVGAGEYEFIDEKSWSQLDMEVHEHPILKGKVGVIKNTIDHKDYKGISQFIHRHNEYSSWEANRFINKSNKMGELTFRQKIKYRLIDSWWLGILYFIYSYFIKLGFLEGRAGFLWAAYKQQYFFNVKAKIDELRREAMS